MNGRGKTFSDSMCSNLVTLNDDGRTSGYQIAAVVAFLCSPAEEPMSTVEEITAAIQHLPADDVARVRAWLAEFTEQLWDEQIERDERAGRLDALIDKALDEHRDGRTRPL